MQSLLFVRNDIPPYSTLADTFRDVVTPKQMTELWRIYIRERPDEPPFVACMENSTKAGDLEKNPAYIKKKLNL